MLISQRKLEMAGRREILAELAMRQQMRAANRLVLSAWFERHGAQAALVALLGGVIAAVLWRLVL